MKCLALFRGEVTCVLRGGTRIVRMWRPSKKKGDEIIADMRYKYAKGLKEGDLFELRVMKRKGLPAFSKVEKWTPPPLGPRVLARISRKVDEWSKGIDWDNL